MTRFEAGLQNVVAIHEQVEKAKEQHMAACCINKSP